MTRLNRSWLPFLFCVVNLLFMHYVFYLTDQLEVEQDATAFVDNLCGVGLDVSVFFLLFYLFSGRRWRMTWMGCVIATSFWSFSNVVYSRFFYHYLSLSSIGQGGALFDSLIIRCVIDKLEWLDLFYPLSLFLFLYYIIRRMSDKRPKRVVRNILFLNVILVFVILGSLAVYCMSLPEYKFWPYYTYKLNLNQKGMHLALCDPVTATFRRGSSRMLALEVYDKMQGTLKLDKKQEDIITETIEESNRNRCLDQNSQPPTNVIFILVESYMSFVSDMYVGGREVTPFLNALKRDSATYYNGSMTANITVGESSDGQFIYLTGLLPLRSAITVSTVKDLTLPGLPKLFGIPSRMVIPTAASMWNQDKMCQQYGFDNLYSSRDLAGDHDANLNDQQVFQLAMEQDEKSKEPFFSMVLTLSMHMPYTEQIDPSFLIKEDSVSNELACYLNACHYTDTQIARYFQYLKSKGLYDRSLIVIASDHHVHLSDVADISMTIPFYVVNGGGRERWKGVCQQVDVYPTLLDIMGIRSRWSGLGQSLLSPNYTAKDMKWDVSEWIIKSDYFEEYLNDKYFDE